MDTKTELDLEIRGEVGYVAKKHRLSDAATADIYKIFCEQARRWESKVGAHMERICNQRKEIARLAASQERTITQARGIEEGKNGIRS